MCDPPLPPGRTRTYPPPKRHTAFTPGHPGERFAFGRVRLSGGGGGRLPRFPPRPLFFFGGRPPARPDHLLPFFRSWGWAETDQPEKAIAAFDDGIALRPDIAQFYLDRGRTFSRLGQHARAIADLDTAVKLDKDANTFELRGRVKIAAEDLDGALADLDEAIRLGPKKPLAYEQRGYAYFRKGDSARALADLNTAAGIAPGISSIHFKRALVYSGLGDRDREIAELDEAIRLNPKFLEALNNRGTARRARGEFDGARADFTQAIRIKPDAAMPLQNRASLNADMKDYDGAVADYSRLIALNPNDSDYYLHRGEAYLGQRDATAALSDFGKALDLYPGEPRAWQGQKRAEALKEGRPVADGKSEPGLDFSHFQSMLNKSRNAAP